MIDNSIKNTAYQKVGNDMTWPKLDQSEVEWLLRYGSKDEIVERRMLIAGIVCAYMSLIQKTQKDRNEICKALKDQYQYDQLFKGVDDGL